MIGTPKTLRVCNYFRLELISKPACQVLCHVGIKYRCLNLFRRGSVAEWLACWTQAQKARVQIVAATLSGNNLRQTAHTHRASVHQAAKLVAALLRVAGVTAGLAVSNGSVPPGLWLTSPAGWLPRIGISSGTVCSVIAYGLPLTLLFVFLSK